MSGGALAATAAGVAILALASSLSLAREPAVAADRPDRAPRGCGTPASATPLARAEASGFIENAGQVDDSVAYYARLGGERLWLTRAGAVWELRRGREQLVLSERFAGSPGAAEIVGLRPLGGRHNFLTGTRPQVGVRAHRSVVYRDAWPGIDVRLSLRGTALKRDYVLRRGGRPERIRIAYRGAERLRIERDGDLRVETALEDLNESRPRAFQRVGGRRVAVPVRYRLTGRHSYGFDVGRYRRDRPLVIDPRLELSRYLGGSGANEVVADVDVDPAGNAYVTGFTSSADFPGVDPARSRFAGERDAFVTKLDPAGRLVYSTYVGTAGVDEARGIAVDSGGSAYITGMSRSLRELATPGAAQERNGGTDIAGSLLDDAFVAKLDPSGARLLYATYLGGRGDDAGNDVSLDAAGNAYVTGITDSLDFPLQGPLQGRLAGTPDPNPPSGEIDAFVTKLASDGSRLAYSTYLGGSGSERGRGIAVDAAGAAHVVGVTDSPDLPTAAPLQATRRGGTDAFVAKLAPAGSSLVHSTYLGGSGEEGAFEADLDGAGRVWLTGDTTSPDLPVPRAAQRTKGGSGPLPQTDAFVAALQPGGSALFYGSYLGGEAPDTGRAIAVDSAGDAHVTGGTSSRDFPTAGAFQPQHRPFSEDAFVARIDAASGTLAGASYLGGAAQDNGRGIAVDGAGNAWVGGFTQSPDLPAAVSGRIGAADGFVAKVAPGGAAPSTRSGRPHVWADVIARPRIRTGRPTRLTVMFGNSGTADAHGVPIWIDGIPRDAKFSLDVDVLPPEPRSAEERDFLARVPISLEARDATALPLYLPSIPAGATASFTLTLTVPRDGRFKLRAWADPPWFASPPSEAATKCLTGVLREVFERASNGLRLPGACVAPAKVKKLIETVADQARDQFFDQLPTSPDDVVVLDRRAVISETKLAAAMVLMLADCAADVAGIVLPQQRLLVETLELFRALGSLGSQGGRLAALAAECRRAFTRGQGAPPGEDVNGSSSPAVEQRVESGSSQDPNDKVGSRGRGRGRFIPGTEPLRYTIFFENLEQATLPAQQVVITDRLDASKLDLGRLALGTVTFGQKRVDPPLASRSFAADVDLRPERNLIVRVEGALSGGVITWRLRALDPATGRPPEDPAAGFLPPNRTPPEGDGSVSFTVMPKRGLRTGTRIRNGASIVFDENAPIVTPVWVNRIDRSPPASRVRSVAGRGKRHLRLRWLASDRGSGIAHFTLFRSQNGGRFRPLHGTKRRSALVRLRRGRSVFYTAALDRAGNFERQPVIGDLMAPALRARRRGSGLLAGTRIHVQGPARLVVSARNRRRPIRLLRGSRAGVARARGARRRISVRVRRPGKLRLALRLRARDLRGARTGNVLVRVAGRRGETLRIPFRR